MLSLAPAASAGGHAVKAWEVTAHDDGGQFWFTVEGLDGRNPTIRVDPGDTIQVTLTNDGTVGHNIVIDELGLEIPCCVRVGESDNTTFTVPMDAAGEFPYLCQPHEDLGMTGTLVVGGQQSTPALGWLPVALLTGAFALVDRRRRG